jgi:hypothetical protein
MPNTDRWGLPISAGSAEAANAYREGMDLLLAAWPGAGDRLDAAIAADPDFALAHAAGARVQALNARPAVARASISHAEQIVSRRGDERERSHVGVVAHALNGRSQLALKTAEDHVARWPRDVTVASMLLGAFGLYAFSGMADHDQARVGLCARMADHFEADDWWFNTSHGWALAENGEVERGWTMLEHAFERRPENANTVHALAHAMFEAGASDPAEELIESWLPTYDRSGVLHGHIAWHGALVALERGDAETALSIYRDQVQPSVTQAMPINVVSDAASLLWRIAAYGHEVPEGLWRQAADYSHTAFPAAGHAFIDTHMLMVAAATGDNKALEARLTALDEMVTNGRLGAGAVVPTMGRAMQAFAEGDYARCVAILEPYAGEVVRIGGSGAQRQVIADTLVVAMMRAGETGKAAKLLDGRLHRRPSHLDARWRESIAA